MATREQMIQALKIANDNGDKQNALKIANMIKQSDLGGGQPQPAPQPQTLTEQNTQKINEISNTIKGANKQVQTLNKQVQEDKGDAFGFGKFNKGLIGALADVTGFADTAKDVVDVAPTIASSAVAEPTAGIAGLISSGAIKIGEKLGLTDKSATDVGTDVINSVRDFISIKPDAEAEDVLLKVAETVKPITDKIEASSDRSADFYGELAKDLLGEDFEVAGKVFGKTMHKATELAAETLVGAGTGKALKAASNKIDDISLNKEIAKDADNFSVDPKKIKEVVNKQFEDIKKKGVKLSKDQIDNFKKDIAPNFKEMTISKDVTGKTYGILKRMSEKIKTGNVDAVDFQNFRSELGSVSRGTDPTDAAAANRFISNIDNTLDPIDDLDFQTARRNDLKRRKIKQIDKSIREANIDVKARGKNFTDAIKSPIIALLKKDARKDAKDQSFLFRKEKEINALEKISAKDDTTLESIFGMVSELRPSGAKFGVSDAINIATGSMTGRIGDFAKLAIDKIKIKNAEAAKRLIASDNANDIIKAYHKNIPKKEQSVSELTALILKDGVKDFDAAKAINKNSRQAIRTAKNWRNFVNAFKDTDIKAESSTAVGLEGLDELIDNEESEGLNIDITSTPETRGQE